MEKKLIREAISSVWRTFSPLCHLSKATQSNPKMLKPFLLTEIDWPYTHTEWSCFIWKCYLIVHWYFVSISRTPLLPTPSRSHQLAVGRGSAASSRTQISVIFYPPSPLCSVQNERVAICCLSPALFWITPWCHQPHPKVTRSTNVCSLLNLIYQTSSVKLIKNGWLLIFAQPTWKVSK